MVSLWCAKCTYSICAYSMCAIAAACPSLRVRTGSRNEYWKRSLSRCRLRKMLVASTGSVTTTAWRVAPAASALHSATADEAWRAALQVAAVWTADCAEHIVVIGPGAC